LKLKRQLYLEGEGGVADESMKSGKHVFFSSVLSSLSPSVFSLLSESLGMVPFFFLSSSTNSDQISNQTTCKKKGLLMKARYDDIASSGGNFNRAVKSDRKKQNK
jgi:hypothetical protein